jgi:two-component system sensor histidine kinase AlgZ
MPPHRHGCWYWVRILIVNAVGALMAFGFLGGLITDAPWSERWPNLFASFVYANCIGGTMALLMPIVLHRISTRHRATVWAVRLALIPVTIVIGYSIAGVVGILLGFIRPDRYFAQFRTTLWISLFTATVACLVLIGYETLRGQLDAATDALRAKERDQERMHLAAAEARLASLESRVNPHFLFNTLNSIAALTHLDPAGAERMTNQLASLMRSSLDARSTALVTLDEELRVVRDYLEIERVRFGDRLRFAIDVDERANATRLPRLSLQTLVENSVKYAIGSRREGGHLAVRASAAHDVTRLVVEDDGPGFDSSLSYDGHGLALLQARLDMHFGVRAWLEIDSRPGRTCATITVPRGAGGPDEG